jgi:hypothetical protein
MRTRSVTLALFFLAASAAAEPSQVTGSRYLPTPTSHWSLQRAASTDPVCYTASNTQITPCVLDFQYYGGPVLSNVKVYAVFWNNEVDADIVDGVGGFYQTLTDSQWVDWLTEYSTTLNVQAGGSIGRPGTQQVIGRGTFAGNFTLPVLSTAYPPCTNNTNLTCVTDADVQGELVWQVAHNNLPIPDNNTLFVVHFPASVQIQMGKPIAESCVQFCSYHSGFTEGLTDGGTQDVFYAVVPDLGVNGCQNGCGQGTTFQNTCMVASHEIAESITDTLVGLATTANYPLAWYDLSQGEICDVCLQHPDTVDVDGITGKCTGDADAGCYTLQQCFSKTVWDENPTAQPNVAACVSSRFDTNDYSIAFVPNGLTLAPGTTATIPVVTTVTNGSPQPLTLSIPALPPGLDAGLDDSSPMSGATANLTVSANANATLFRSGVLVVQASGPATHSASLLVQLVVSPNDWSLYLSPPGTILFAGKSQVFTVGAQVTLGAAEPITLSSAVGGLPPGVTASFNTLTLTPGTSTAQLTLTASAGAAAAAPTVFTVTGVSTSQPAGHTGGGTVQVDTLPGVAFTNPTAGATVTGPTVVSVAATPGANSAIARIALSVDGNQLSNSTASSVHWDSRGVANGSHTLTATVLDTDGASATTSIVILVSNVFNDFTLSLSPQSVVVPSGGSVQLTLTTTLAAGEAEPITLAFTTLPPEVNASFNPAPVTAGGSSVVTLTSTNPTANSPATTASLLGTTVSQPKGHTATLSVAVQVGGATSSGGCTAAGTPSRGLPLLLAGLLLWRRRRQP